MSDESEHAIEQAELAAWDTAKRLEEETDDAMFRQNIEYHDRIVDLERSLRAIWKIVHTPTKQTRHRLAPDHYQADFDAIRKIIRASEVTSQDRV